MPFLIDRIKELEKQNAALRDAVYSGATYKALPLWVVNLPLREYDQLVEDMITIMMRRDPSWAMHFAEQRKLLVDMVA